MEQNEICLLLNNMTVSYKCHFIVIKVMIITSFSHRLPKIIDGQRKKNVIIGGEYVHNFYIDSTCV